MPVMMTRSCAASAAPLGGCSSKSGSSLCFCCLRLNQIEVTIRAPDEYRKAIAGGIAIDDVIIAISLHFEHCFLQCHGLPVFLVVDVKYLGASRLCGRRFTIGRLHRSGFGLTRAVFLYRTHAFRIAMGVAPTAADFHDLLLQFFDGMAQSRIEIGVRAGADQGVIVE